MFFIGIRILIECVFPHNILWLSQPRWLIAQQHQYKYCRKWISPEDLLKVCFLHNICILRGPWHTIIKGLDWRYKYVLSHLKMTVIFIQNIQRINKSLINVNTYDFQLEFSTNSHGKLSTQVCLHRSFILDPNSYWTNPGPSDH